MYASKRAARSHEEQIAPTPLLGDQFQSTDLDPGLQLAK
jgi:hypothetical protein